MELTFESAVSPGGLVGHLSYLLLVISMLMRRIGPLRFFALGSALVAIGYGVIWLKDPVGVFWESLLAAINIAQLFQEGVAKWKLGDARRWAGRIRWANRRVRRLRPLARRRRPSVPRLRSSGQPELI